MKKTLEPYQLIERSIIKKYRKELWAPFIVAVKRYELVQAGDRIAVCISGGKDSMFMAKLMLFLLSLHNKSPCPGRLQRYLLHFALPQTRGFTLNASTFTAFDTVAAELAPSVAACGFSPVAVPSPDSAGWIL